jgi:ribosomal protein S18 acetylase RimI-like enzyme
MKQGPAFFNRRVVKHMVRLRRMSQAEYEDYYKDSVRSLAEELTRAGGLSLQDALAAAQRSFASLLPDGSPSATDQYLYSVLEGEQKIGVLWFGIKRDRSKPEAYVWDIVIEQPHRGKGYGKQTMLALEEEVKGLGLSRISLNVFEHNVKARQLYERLNYKTTSRIMAKEL